MSVAYFIVLENQEVDFDTFVNGKSIAHAFDDLIEFCNTQKLKTIEDFHSQNTSEFMEDFDYTDIPEQEIKWFDAQEGIDWASSLIKKIESEEPKFGTCAIIEDLREYLEVFNNAKKVNVKWHLELDY